VTVAPEPASPKDLAARVTATDLLKVIGVAALLIDHYGLFYQPDDVWWRLVGRTASPIFFFLIGFARTRAVPWTWLAFGAALTGLNLWMAGGWANPTFNILLNFALLRAVVLPPVAQAVLPRPVPLAMLIAGCVLLIPVTDGVLEYGTEGWLWAFLGLAHRDALEDRGRRTNWTRAGLALAAAAAYIAREIHDYGFDVVQSTLLAVVVAVLTVAFTRFRREDLRWQPPQPLAAVFRFCGRHSLEIYAITLFVMQSHGSILAAAARRGEP
jgi:FtsH-binding integral membrane protein